MAKEIWKDIEGYVGLYQVSNLGRVRSLDRFVIQKNGTKRFLKGRVLKHSNIGGYAAVVLRSPQKMFFVHRLVAMAFIPNPKNYPVVNHLDCNKSFNYYKNLEWTTQRENLLHAYKHELAKAKKGAESPRAKLTQSQANEIRQLYFAGCYSMPYLAKKYGVSQTIVHHIISNKTYYDKKYTPPKEYLNRKLTFKQAEEIRNLYSTGNFTQRALAEKYKISQDAIYQIIHNLTYVDENYTPPKVNLKLKLIFKQAEEIRNLYSTGNFTMSALAEKYSVSLTTIHNIVHNKVYKTD